MRPRKGHYRLEVYHPTGATTTRVIDPTLTTGATRHWPEAILGLEEATTGPLGDCIDASLRIENTRPADMFPLGHFIHIHLGDDSDSAKLVWRGRIIESTPHQAGREPITVTATGLKQELYDIPIPAPVVGGGDAALVATRLLESIDFWPGSGASDDRGLDLPQPTIDGDSWFPLLHFQVGARYPNFETAGDALDALADMLPSFLVPSGESYTYDGTTYNAGDRVPAVRWGVTAEGRVAFGRPQGTVVSIAPADDDPLFDHIMIQQERASGEDLYDRATMIYQSEFGEDAEFYAVHPTIIAPTHYPDTPFRPYPIARTVEAAEGPYGHTRSRIFTPEGPMDFMVARGRTGGHDNFGSLVDNPTNAFDGDSNTFAEWSTSITAGESEAMSWSYEGNQIEGFLMLDLSAGQAPVDESDQFPSAGGGWGLLYQATFLRPVGGSSWERVAGTRPILLEAPTNRSTVVLPCLLPAISAVGDITRLQVRIEAGQEARLYTAEFLVPDLDTLQDIADGIAMPADRPAGDVTFYQEVHTGVGRVNLGSTDTPIAIAQAERTTFFATNEEGYGTRIRYGSPLPPDALNYRRALEKLIKRESRRRS